MLADNFFAAIALDAFRPRVPTGDHALGINHKYGIVRYAFDQQSEPLFTLAKSLLMLLSFGKVTCDLREPEQLSVFVPQRGDHHTGPEARTILAEAPPLILQSPFPGRYSELFVRPAAVNRFARIENRKMAPYDFLRSVPLDALGTAIPCRNPALGIKREQRIIYRLFGHHSIDGRIHLSLVIFRHA